MGAENIRELMLAAHARQLTGGTSMFFNVDLFNASSYGNVHQIPSVRCRPLLTNVAFLSHRSQVRARLMSRSRGWFWESVHPDVDVPPRFTNLYFPNEQIYVVFRSKPVMPSNSAKTLWAPSSGFGLCYVKADPIWSQPQPGFQSLKPKRCVGDGGVSAPLCTAGRSGP